MTRLIGKNVLLRGDHPHSGKMGKIVAVERVTGGSNGWKIELAGGGECFVFDPMHMMILGRD